MRDARAIAGLSIEAVAPEDVPHWNSAAFADCRAVGDRWYDERRTPVLLVPPVVTVVERNVLMNQEHPDFARIRARQPLPVDWDARLWKSERTQNRPGTQNRP